MAIRTPLQSASHAAELLYERGARRVWAFGSLGEGHPLDVHSDVDLAVEGLSEAVIEQTKAQLKQNGPCKVDIIAMERSDAQLRWFVSRGRLIPQGSGSSLSNPLRGSLKQRRLAAVVEELRSARARRIVDLGCGPCWLVELLVGEPWVDSIFAIDKDDRVASAARRRLAERLTSAELALVTVSHGLFTWRDPRLAGHDAAVAMEVIEHLEAPQLAAFASVLFGFARPRLVVMTTPNADYNPRLRLGPGERRHPDHRFEWTRAEFAAWAADVGGHHGYEVEHLPVGDAHPECGPPTQLARFTTREAGHG